MTTTDSNKYTYAQKVAACDEFQRQLERQFGKRAVDMRYTTKKSLYDAQTRAACQAFRKAHGLPERLI